MYSSEFCQLLFLFSKYKYRKGSIRTAVLIEPPPQKILKIVIKKMVKIIPPPFFTLKLQGGTLEFLYKKIFSR